MLCFLKLLWVLLALSLLGYALFLSLPHTQPLCTRSLPPLCNPCSCTGNIWSLHFVLHLPPLFSLCLGTPPGPNTQFYMAMFYEFYDQWVSTGATIADMHTVMTSVETVCRKSPASAIAKFQAGVLKPRQAVSEEPAFTSIS
jgi:hypothetical protein